MPQPTTTTSPQRRVWWSNAILFVGIHLAAVVGTYFYPLRTTPKPTLVLAAILWQIACFSITIGYHRLYSHRSFEAGFATRVTLALLGASAFQGSIKWWVLRHRLHHRFTDDPDHDPYAATRGLLWSHLGWIFFKQHYERLDQIDKEDLESDSVVQFQHNNYVLLALFTSFAVPVLLGSLWGDRMGAFIWGGLIARIAVWHCTFLVNSLAHWDGLQPYTDENTSRMNFIVALLTCGEGNHNFHAFPHDFRSGPSSLDWDPSKWIILLLYRVGLVSKLRMVKDADVAHAQHQMHVKAHPGLENPTEPTEPKFTALPIMTFTEICDHVASVDGRCVLLIDDAVVDVTTYLDEHPGGASLLRKYSIKASLRDEENPEKSLTSFKTKTTSAFHGGMNNHSRVAKKLLREYTIARLIGADE